MAVNLSPVGGVAAQFFDNSGNPLSGGKLYSYAAGTTTPATTYTSSNGNVAHSNPIVLDAAGRVPAGGEIWLTDGINYKFVLKTSTDTLIATYDNITGINSNAIAYNSQQEIQTATAGQTVFTLANSYLPGTNSLSVFVDGVNQYGPGAQYAYVETNTTTVTFNNGLHSGALVKFTTTQQQGAGAVDSAQVSYVPPFTGAVATNVEARLAETVSVKDFGAVGDGVTNDRAAIQAAFDSGAKSVYFPSGTYWLGSTASSINFIDLSNWGSGRAIVTDKSVTITCQTTANVIPHIFYMFGNSKFSCGPISFQDLGYDPLVTWRGAVGFYIDNNTTGAGNWGDLTFEAIYARNLVAAMIVAGGDATHRVRGIHIGQLFSDDCYYGFNSQNQGDGVKIDNLISYQNYRPYFVYGVVDHKVKIFNRANRGTSGAVNICRQVGGFNTQGIEVSYVARDQTNGITHVLINHIDLLGGTISDIKVHTDIESSVIYSPVRFVNYTGSGGTETNAPSLNYVYDVTLTGSCDVQANPVSAVASYAGKRRLNITTGQNFGFNSTITSLFYLDATVRDSNALNWVTTGTSPVLGNGTLLMSYDLIAGVCVYSISFTAGSTTTFGTNEWQFTAPYTATVSSVGSVWALQNGVSYYVGACTITAGSDKVLLWSNGATTAFRNTIPFTWAANDRFQLTISYPIS